MHELLLTTCYVILGMMRIPGGALHLSATFITHLSNKKTVFKSFNITFKILSTLSLFYLPSSSFPSMRKQCLFRQTSPQTSRHEKVGSCAKSWQYDLDSHSHGSFSIDFIWARISPLLVSSLARIIGMKLVVREEIRLLFYTNAQMSNVYKENRKDHKKD